MEILYLDDLTTSISANKLETLQYAIMATVEKLEAVPPPKHGKNYPPARTHNPIKLKAGKSSGFPQWKTGSVSCRKPVKGKTGLGPKTKTGSFSLKGSKIPTGFAVEKGDTTSTAEPTHASTLGVEDVGVAKDLSSGLS